MGRGAGRDGSVLKSAVLVTGGLALAWLAVEIAFKPVLDSLRGAISRSDPTRDPDDELEKEGNDSSEIKTVNEEDKEKKNGKDGGVSTSV